MARGSLPSSEADFPYNDSHKPQRPLRIGWLTNALKKPDPKLQAVVEQALAVLKQHGASVADAALPEGPFEEAASVIIGVEGTSAFQTLLASGKIAELDDPLGKIAGYVNEQIPATDYLLAQRIRGVAQAKVDALFDRFDVIAAASLPITATTLETNLETDLSFPDPLGGLGNLCGLPAISVPCGFSDDKLPIGLQFVARTRNDRLVVAAAHLFQQHTDWHLRRPPL